jgi:hypothetical protein
MAKPKWGQVLPPGLSWILNRWLHHRFRISNRSGAPSLLPWSWPHAAPGIASAISSGQISLLTNVLLSHTEGTCSHKLLPAFRSITHSGFRFRVRCAVRAISDPGAMAPSSCKIDLSGSSGRVWTGPCSSAGPSCSWRVNQLATCMFWQRRVSSPGSHRNFQSSPFRPPLVPKERPQCSKRSGKRPLGPPVWRTVPLQVWMPIKDFWSSPPACLLNRELSPRVRRHIGRNLSKQTDQKGQPAFHSTDQRKARKKYFLNQTLPLIPGDPT